MKYPVIGKHALLLSGFGLLSLSAPLSAAGLTEIVVSASLVEKPRHASGSAITVLDASHLEQNQIRTVSDALRDAPGVAVNRSGGLGTLTQVRLRGAEGNHTLVLIDGIEVNDVSAGSEFDFANLMNLQIERIEVLRGAQSALWGSDAMGGVINIITKKGAGALNGLLTLETGSFDTQRQAFNINAGGKNYHYSLSASNTDSGGISALNEDRGYPEEDGYQNTTVNLKAGWQASEKLSFDLVLRQLEAEVETDGFTFGVGPVDDNSSSETRQKFGRLSSRLALLDGRWQHKLSMSGNETDNESFSASNYFSQGKKKKLAYQTDFFIAQDRLDHRLTLAAEREKEEFANQSAFSALDRETELSSLIFEYGLDINDRYHATLAGRRDNNDIFKDAKTYRFTLAGWLTDNIRAHASKGSGVKNPTFFELFGSTPTYSGNPNLTPEKNTTWDAGAEYHFKSVNGYIDLTYFHSDVHNLISGAGNTAINAPNTSNIEGWELSAVFKPTPNLRVNASYTYTDTEDGNGNELVRRPRHIASLNSSYLLPNGKTRLTGGVQYNGEQDDLEFDAFFNQTQVTLSDYTLVNLAVSHQLSEQIELFARVDNLLDEEYEEVLTYGTQGIGGTVGITFRGGL
ncbi:MAG: TonB-dependent receptor [Pseudomonadales bacterium]